MDNNEFLSVLVWKYIYVYNFVVSTYKGLEHVTTYSFSLIWYEPTPSGEISPTSIFMLLASSILCWVVLKADNYLKEHENYLDNHLHTIPVQTSCQKALVGSEVGCLCLDLWSSTRRQDDIQHLLTQPWYTWYLLTLLYSSNLTTELKFSWWSSSNMSWFPRYHWMFGLTLAWFHDLPCWLCFTKTKVGPPTPPAYEWLFSGSWEILIFKAMSWDSFNSQNPL